MPEPEQSKGRSVVNDVEQDDPPEVAQARSLGLFPQEAVPVGRIQIRDVGRAERPLFAYEPGIEFGVHP
jgi:hypothetical protein